MPIFKFKSESPLIGIDIVKLSLPMVGTVQKYGTSVEAPSALGLARLAPDLDENGDSLFSPLLAEVQGHNVFVVPLPLVEPFAVAGREARNLDASLALLRGFTGVLRVKLGNEHLEAGFHIIVIFVVPVVHVEVKFVFALGHLNVLNQAPGRHPPHFFQAQGRLVENVGLAVAGEVPFVLCPFTFVAASVGQVLSALVLLTLADECVTLVVLVALGLEVVAVRRLMLAL